MSVVERQNPNRSAQAAVENQAAGVIEAACAGSNHEPQNQNRCAGGNLVIIAVCAPWAAAGRRQ